MQRTDLSFEIRRKTFHLYGLIFPIFYLVIAKFWMVFLLSLLTCVVLYLDICRHYNTQIQIWTNKIFARFMRKSEQSGSFALSGASFMICGFFITSLCFSKGLVITSWLILIIADPAASLVGIIVGHHAISGKSLEGALAFMICAVFCSLLGSFYIGYQASLINILASCLMTTIIELYAKKIRVDDNLLIPLTYCSATSMLALII